MLMDFQDSLGITMYLSWREDVKAYLHIDILKHKILQKIRLVVLSPNICTPKTF